MKKFQVMGALASALMLAGCGLIKTSSSTSTTTPSGTTTSSSSSAPDERGGETAAASNNSGLSGLFVRGDFEQVKGLPVEEAKAKAKALGHDGKVVVQDLRTYRKGCADGIVCEATDEREGWSGMGNHEKLYLWVNPKLTIDGPPPD